MVAEVRLAPQSGGRGQESRPLSLLTPHLGRKAPSWAALVFKAGKPPFRSFYYVLG